MIGFSITLAIFFLLLAFTRLLSEVVIAMGNDTTGELEEQLETLVNKLQEAKISILIEICLFFGITMWIYFSGFVFCAQLLLASMTALYWPQRYFK